MEQRQGWRCRKRGRPCETPCRPVSAFPGGSGIRVPPGRFRPGLARFDGKAQKELKRLAAAGFRAINAGSKCVQVKGVMLLWAA